MWPLAAALLMCLLLGVFKLTASHQTAAQLLTVIQVLTNYDQVELNLQLQREKLYYQKVQAEILLLSLASESLQDEHTLKVSSYRVLITEYLCWYSTVFLDLQAQYHPTVLILNKV